MGARVTKRMGDELHQRVRRLTPVAKETAAVRASYPSLASWIAARHRRPGELRGSWRVGDVKVILDGERTTVTVYTLDPVAPHVEWDTAPHLIRPRRPGGVLTVPTRDGMLFMREVHHPGTRGVHMMATALAEVAATWEGVARDEWEREMRVIWR